MEEETVEFKLDVSDESIKRESMKVVWMFSGVTLVDIKERGIIKVRGKFDKIEMGSKLYEIDNSVDIINPKGKAKQSYIPGLNTVYNYLITPKLQEIVVFKFKVLDEGRKHDAMEAIWEFSGVTSVEVKGVDQLEVKGGEFNKVAMATKLKNIDEFVNVIIKAGPDVQAPNTAQAFRMPAPAPVRVPAPTPVRAPAPAPVHAFARGKRFNDHLDINQPYKKPIIDVVAKHLNDFMYKKEPDKLLQRQHLGDQGWKKPQPEVKKEQHKVKHQEQEGGLFGFFGKKKQQPQKEKVVYEIPKPQGTSKKEGETSHTKTQSSWLTSLTNTINPSTDSQMMSSLASQFTGSTQNKHSTRNGSQSTTQGRTDDSDKLSKRFSSLSRKN